MLNTREKKYPFKKIKRIAIDTEIGRWLGRGGKSGECWAIQFWLDHGVRLVGGARA